MKRALLVCILLAMVLCCVLCLASCKATEPDRTSFVYDDMELFDDNQIILINQAAKDAQQKYGLTVLVATCQRSGSKATLNGEQLMSREGLQGNYTILIINADGLNQNYHFDIYTYGRSARKISDSEVEDILFSIWGDAILTSDSTKAVSGVTHMIDMCGSAYQPKWKAVVIAALIIAVIVTLVVVTRVKRSYSRKRKNDTYPLDKYCRLNLKDRQDVFSHSTTTFVIINSGSSSGGGHFSGGGGGGGHRGGR